MRFVRSILLLIAGAGCASLLACGPVHSVTVGRDRRPPPVVVEDEDHGPPPWAPAHGYRHKHHRAYRSRESTVDLVFDSGLGVYAVVGIPNYYYWNGVYLRIAGDHWWRAPYLDADWESCSEDALPGKLRYRVVKSHDDDEDDDDHGHGKHKHKHKHKRHRHGHDAANRSDD